MSDLYSIPIERHSLSAFLIYQKLFFDYEQFIKDKTFKNPVHQTIYNCIKSAYLNNEQLDNVILSQKLKNLNINFFEENLDIFAYIETLYGSLITEKAGEEAIKELLSLKGCRDLMSMAKEIRDTINNRGSKTFGQLIHDTDLVYSKTLNSLTSNSKQIINIYETIENTVEEKGNNQNKEDMLFGPFPTINRIYGSLLRPAAINLLGARTGVGKTAISMFYLNWVAEKYNIPIIHLDFSEMTEEELKMRAVCLFTEGKVPYFALESGQWRNNKEWTNLVRAVWPRVKKLKMFYYDIGGLLPEEIVALLKRIYYQKIGRGNKVLINYDYCKPFNNPKSNKTEWSELGLFIGAMKSLMVNEIPDASLWLGIQNNRQGITNDRLSNQVDDSENSFSLSDRIIQQATHAWLLRYKLTDELAAENGQFGNMILKNLKSRHLGKDAMHHINMIQMPDKKLKRNYINIEHKSFFYEDKGDLNDLVKSGLLNQKFPTHHNPSTTPSDGTLD